MLTQLTPTAPGPYEPGFQLDPFPTLARLLGEAPITRMNHPEVGECWVAVRHDVVKRLSADRRLIKPQDPKDGNSLNSPPPVHTRLRKLAQAAFTSPRIESLRAWTEQLTHRMIDELVGQRTFDLLGGLANPMPIAVIGTLLGVPAEQGGEVSRIATGFLAETDAERNAAFGSAHGYVVGLVEHKRRSPGDDVTSALIAARDGTDRLDEEELVRMVMALLINGSITTTTVLGTGTQLLLDHRDQWELLQERPRLVRGAVEEVLRMEAPIGAITWEAVDDLPVGDDVIAAGEYVMTSVQGANRDPALFDDPDRFDVTRSPNPHLTFSHGIHHCLGAQLARMELQVAIAAIVRRLADLRPAGDPTWRDSYVVRGLLRLPVEVGGRR